MTKASDLPRVQWQAEDGGWREGVVMALIGEDAGYAIIYDDRRMERHEVPCNKLQLVEKRCEACGGTGEMVECLRTCLRTCPSCHGTGKCK